MNLNVLQNFLERFCVFLNVLIVERFCVFKNINMLRSLETIRGSFINYILYRRLFGAL